MKYVQITITNLDAGDGYVYLFGAYQYRSTKHVNIRNYSDYLREFNEYHQDNVPYIFGYSVIIFLRNCDDII